MTKLIQHRNILPPTRRGSRRDSFIEEGPIYNADVIVGESIRIFGKKRSGQEIVGKRVWSGAGYWAQDQWDWIETVQDHPELITMLTARNAGDPKYAPGMVADWCIEHGADPSLPFDLLQLVNRYVPKYTEFDKTFRIGDCAVERVFNLLSYRPITKITEKTVTITMYSADERRISSGEFRRMSLYEFCQQNWDYGAHRTSEQNQIKSMSI